MSDVVEEDRSYSSKSLEPGFYPGQSSPTPLDHPMQTI